MLLHYHQNYVDHFKLHTEEPAAALEPETVIETHTPEAELGATEDAPETE